MIRVRKSEERGQADYGWLDTRYTFSFARYYDPVQMGFRQLRVINEDRVQPGGGFPTHGHQDMEIITHILEGALEHQDSMGNSSVIRPGEIQRMSAGTGVTHSEYNASKTEIVHLLQIWIRPERSGLAPSYEQKAFPREDRRNRLQLVASRDGRDGSVTIHQDASLYLSWMSSGTELRHRFVPDRHGWLQVARGSVLIDGNPLQIGDGAAVSEEHSLSIQALDDAELLLFDLG
jgi:redox-sensitive bicupin YhaK (pirin superfamily)